MNKCKVCGCTDHDCTQCIQKTGKPCYWVEEYKNLCSACLDEYVIKILIDNLEYLPKKYGMCSMLYDLEDLKIISSEDHILIAEWIDANQPECIYRGLLKSYGIIYAWRPGNVDERYYWLKSELKQYEEKNQRT